MLFSVPWRYWSLPRHIGRRRTLGDLYSSGWGQGGIRGDLFSCPRCVHGASLSACLFALHAMNPAGVSPQCVPYMLLRLPLGLLMSISLSSISCSFSLFEACFEYRGWSFCSPSTHVCRLLVAAALVPLRVTLLAVALGLVAQMGSGGSGKLGPPQGPCFSKEANAGNPSCGDLCMFKGMSFGGRLFPEWPSPCCSTA